VWVADAHLHADSGVRFILEHVAPTKQVAYLFNRRQTILRDYYFYGLHAHFATAVLGALQQGQKL
jgi:hypothetical protein